MIKKSDYYQTIIVEINQLIDQQDWEKALKMLTDELLMPYIPMKYELKFQQLYSDINQKLLEKQTPTNQWTLEKITKSLQADDEEQQLFALYHLQHYNARLILPIIDTFLATSKISNLNKTQLLLILHQQGIDQTFKLIKTHGQFNVNPTKILPPKMWPIFQAIEQILKTIVAVDEPGTYQICLFILNRYFESLLPVVPKINQKQAIAAALYVRACSLQFIKVTLLASAKKFHSTTSLIKLYLLDLNQHQIT